MTYKTFWKEEGFSLTEILVVIVIIGILVLLAMPQFTSVITRAKTTEARTMLKHLHTLQRAYYYENDRYSENLAEIGFEQVELVTEDGEARYRIDIVKADGNGFLGRATAVVDFDKDGTFNVWEVDQSGKIRQVTAD
ncbi:MAG: prepilin-type N-terminal cleavage/methylation domain-containing protein [Gammaproteobacteria bacterium]|nr:prepilin-type N-terminal cleavage/methylation domain-containing protein [candidate division Zixibacteria bacterium]NIR94890.1 prepilin-type N-terminal cleavage/methylation domain-containing protein [Gammaproteobacteria bacterium]NIT59524.1 prepilin-type N-terminal cleavage/methylation domain-containing protein [Fodinibius sp.]NIS47528.1 prepilin-type N-terminal cleavage/methylation domain-containing protein [candidate division Zixibacteria bacterium]NIU15625.1 prepilin-type N-terminal cleava